VKRLVAPADADPAYLARRFRSEGPIVRYRERGRLVVAVLGIERGNRLLDEAKGALRSPPLPFSVLIPRGHLRYMSEQDHETYRRALAPALSVEACRENETAVRQAWTEAIGASSGPAEHAARVLLEATRDALAVLGVGEAAGPAFAAFLRRLPVGRLPLVRRRHHARTLDAAVALLERASPGSLWSRAAVSPDDRTLPRLFVYSLGTGATDVAGLLHWLLDELAHDPDWAARGTDPALASAIVDETLRLHRSEFLYRRADERVGATEVDVPRGALVRVCIAESHRDPDRFPDPDRFDPGRFLAGPPPAGSYQPFGRGSSRCLAAPLVLELGRLFVEEASRRRLTVTANRRPVFDGFHWQPGSSLLVSDA
jgi:cytochrome P450